MSAEQRVDRLIGKAVLQLGLVSPSLVYLMGGLVRSPTCGGTMGVALNSETSEITLIYNPVFVQLISAIHPRMLASVLLHEAGHLLFMHHEIIGDTAINASLSQDISEHELALALDILANAYVCLKNIASFDSAVPLLCPICAKATSLDEYISEARASISTDVYNTAPQEMLSSSNYSCINDLTRCLPSHPIPVKEDRCSYCYRKKCGISNSTLDKSYTTRRAIIEVASGDVCRVIDTLVHSVRALADEVIGTDIPPLVPLVAKYGEEDGSFIHKAFYSEAQLPGELIPVGDSGKIEELSWRLKSKIKKAMQSEGNGAGTKSMYHPIDVAEIFKEHKIKWDSYLRQTVCTSIRSTPEPSRMIRNRRFGFSYPGAKKVESVEIVVAIDVSGSMPNELISKIKSNILALKTKVNVICTVIEFDTKVMAEYPLSELTAVRHSDGGTDLAAPIEWLIDKKLPKGVPMFIFTDGEGPVELSEEHAPKVNRHKYNWMLIGGTRYSIDRFVGKYSSIIDVEL